MRIPKLLPYAKLIKYINSLNIGNVKQLSNFCVSGEKVNGAYRELHEFLPILAELYIEIDHLLGCDSYIIKFGHDH